MKTKWNVQQAYPIEKYPLKNGEIFWLTQKLNGIRATYYNGSLYARSGTEFEGLEHITDVLDRFCGLVFDGELTLIDKTGRTDNEAFRTAAGIVSSGAPKKPEIGFTIFDVLPTVDFDSPSPQMTYSSRRKILDDLSAAFAEIPCVSVLPVLYHGTDHGKIDDLLERMVKEDKEGLMLNKDVPYRKTRHNGILKIKRFYTMDLPIIRCEIGTGKCAGTLGALIVNYKGNEVGIGTGFTDAQRNVLWQKRDSLPGTLCEVKYKEISYDKKTMLESLQFPVFVGLRTDKTEVSYA